MQVFGYNCCCPVNVVWSTCEYEMNTTLPLSYVIISLIVTHVSTSLYVPREACGPPCIMVLVACCRAALIIA